MGEDSREKILKFQEGIISKLKRTQFFLGKTKNRTKNANGPLVMVNSSYESSQVLRVFQS